MPCQGRQPPKAGAEGPPLQGMPPSHTRPPRSMAAHCEGASCAIFMRIYAAGNKAEGFDDVAAQAASSRCSQPLPRFPGERWARTKEMAEHHGMPNLATTE
jgi:hypothetical protein